MAKNTTRRRNVLRNFITCLLLLGISLSLQSENYLLLAIVFLRYTGKQYVYFDTTYISVYNPFHNYDIIVNVCRCASLGCPFTPHTVTAVNAGPFVIASRWSAYYRSRRKPSERRQRPRRRKRPSKRSVSAALLRKTAKTTRLLRSSSR